MMKVEIHPLDIVIKNIHLNAQKQKKLLELELLELPANAPQRDAIKDEINLQKALLDLNKDPQELYSYISMSYEKLEQNFPISV